MCVFVAFVYKYVNSVEDLLEVLGISGTLCLFLGEWNRRTLNRVLILEKQGQRALLAVIKRAIISELTVENAFTGEHLARVAGV